MSFTIKCNKCGVEQEFTSKSKRYEENIGVDVYVRGTYTGDMVEEIDIECLNPKCDNSIEIRF
jgi:hypothetical protein